MSCEAITFMLVLVLVFASGYAIGSARARDDIPPEGDIITMASTIGMRRGDVVRFHPTEDAYVVREVIDGIRVRVTRRDP